MAYLPIGSGRLQHNAYSQEAQSPMWAFPPTPRLPSPVSLPEATEDGNSPATQAQQIGERMVSDVDGCMVEDPMSLALQVLLTLILGSVMLALFRGMCTPSIDDIDLDVGYSVADVVRDLRYLLHFGLSLAICLAVDLRTRPRSSRKSICIWLVL